MRQDGCPPARLCRGQRRAFCRTYLDGAYPYAVATGLDLNGDGTSGTPPGDFPYANDAQGFGLFEGQYGMAVLSRFPIDTSSLRTFQTFLWADMPEARLPVTQTGESFYSGDVLDILHLSSKSHWDVPITVGETSRSRLLASLPTPPVFEGAPRIATAP
jgi:hypothetical protein